MSKARLKVVDDNGKSQPFLRGVLIHTLQQWGMDFKKAYKVAQVTKQRLGKRDEIKSAELRREVQEEIRKRYGKAYLDKLNTLALDPTQLVRVTTGDSASPFSKGLLAKSLTASGLEPNTANRFALDLHRELLETGAREITSGDLYNLVYRRLEAAEGLETAQAYDLARRINRLDKPVIIYLCGALGTGKSTMATELAARLGILKVTGTDMIRQIMRMVFADNILPSLHMSSFEVGANMVGFEHLEGRELVLTGFQLQSSKVCIGVKAVVERSIQENMNVILEGVHLLPNLIQWPEFENAAYHIPIVLSLLNEEEHKSRFELRSRKAHLREPSKYEKRFHDIRAIHDHFIEAANQQDIDVVDNSDFDHCINDLVQIVISNLQKKIQEG